MFDVAVRNLTGLGYTVRVFESSAQAVCYLSESIDKCTVGMGGSVTLAQMGLADELGSHNDIYWHQGVSDKYLAEQMKQKAASADIYISSVNALSETGEIINIDGSCNRVSAILHGHKKVYLIAGKNKLARDFDSALWRARNIAAPLNAKRLSRKTPCVQSGHCHDCKSPERICRALTVLWTKPTSCEFEIILIDEELGY